MSTFDHLSIWKSLQNKELNKCFELVKKEHEDPFLEDNQDLLRLLQKPVCFLITGKPGAGKSTLAQKIVDLWNSVLVSPAAVILHHISTKTDIGIELESKLINGEALSDKVVFDLLIERLKSDEVAHHGYVLDGFPCANDSEMAPDKQIQFLQSMEMKPDFIINLKLSNEDLEIRRLGQKVDEEGQVFVKENYDPDKPEKKKEEEKKEEEGGEEEAEEEEAEEEEEEEVFAGTADFPLLSPEQIEQLMSRPEDLPGSVTKDISEYQTSLMRLLEDLMANHDQQYIIEVNANLTPTDIFSQVTNKLNAFNVRPTPVPVQFFESQNEDDQAPEEMETEELMRMLSAKNIAAPRFRWQRSCWQRYCPVALHEGNLLPGKPEFSVSFLNKAFCCSSAEAMHKFLMNPRMFLLPPQPKPPCKVIVTGSSVSGKTTTAYLLAKKYNAQVLDFAALIQPKIDEQKKENLRELAAKVTEVAITQVKNRIREELEAERQAALAKEEEAAAPQKTEGEEEGEEEEKGEEEEVEEKTEEETEEEEKAEEEEQTPEESAPGEDEAPKPTTAPVEASAVQSTVETVQETIPDPEVESTHPEVVKIVEAALEQAKGKVVTLKGEVYVQVLEDAIRQIEKEKRAKYPKGSLHGGWVIDNFPSSKDVWSAVLEKGPELGIIPDEVVVLRDASENGDYLLKRWYRKNKEILKARIQARWNEENIERKKREEEELARLEEERRIIAEEERLAAEAAAATPAEEKEKGEEDEEEAEEEEKDEEEGEEEEEKEKAKESDKDEESHPEPVPKQATPEPVEEIDVFASDIPLPGPEVEEYKQKRKEFDNDWNVISAFISANTSVEPMEIYVNDRTVESIVEEIVKNMERIFKYVAAELTGQDIEEEEEDNEAAKAEEEKGEDEEEEGEEEEEDPNRSKKKLLGDTNFFCPVALKDHEVMWPGNPEIAAKYRNKIYYFSSEDSRSRFLENPKEFLPSEKPLKATPLRLFILGVKGAGKTLHGKHLARKLGLFHISFKDRLQEVVLPKTKKRIGPEYEEKLEDLPEELPDDVPETAITGPDGEAVTVQEDEATTENPETETEEQEVIYTEIEESVKKNLETQDPLSPEALTYLLADFWKKEPYKNTGFVIEGFPRGPDEAQFLAENGFLVDAAVFFEIEDPEDVFNRLLPPKMAKWKARRNAKNAIKDKNKEKKEKRRQVEIEKRRKELIAEMEERKKELQAEKAAERQQKIDEGDEDAEEEEEEEEEEEDELANIEAVLAEEFEVEEEAEEEEEETEEDAKDQMKQDLSDVYDADQGALATVKESLEEMLIPKFELNAAKKLNLVRHHLFKNLKHLIHDRKSVFERVYHLSEKTANKLLTCGYSSLSNFGKWCPLTLYEGNCIPPIIDEAHPTFPAVYRGYIYYLASHDKREQFFSDPRKFLDNVQYPKIVVPIKIAILGPPKSGKTTLANRFVKEYGVVRISAGEALRTIITEQKKTALAKDIQKYLLMGDTVPEELVIRAVETVMMDTKCATRGYVLDGFPVTIKQVQLMTRQRIIPHKIVELTVDNQELMIRGTTDRLRSDKPYIMHDSPQILAAQLSLYAQESVPVISWYKDEHKSLFSMDGKQSKWLIWEQCIKEVKTQVKHIQDYIYNTRRDKAASIADMCITHKELLSRLGEFKQYCPVRLQDHGELFNCEEQTSMKFAVEFRGRYYMTEGIAERDSFLKNSKKYVPPLAERSLPPPEMLPKKLSSSEIKAKFPMQLYLQGYCPVTFLNGKLRYEAIVPGNKEILAEYRERIFCFTSECTRDVFLRFPEKYWDLKLPSKLPPLKKPTDVRELNLPGYLEQTLAEALKNALTAVANAKPKFPFLSSSRSAMIYVAYHLKAFSPNNPEHMRTKYKKKLEEFEKKCDLVKYLGDNMTLKYKDSSQRPVRFDSKMELFQKMKKLVDVPDTWLT